MATRSSRQGGRRRRRAAPRQAEPRGPGLFPFFGGTESNIKDEIGAVFGAVPLIGKSLYHSITPWHDTPPGEPNAANLGKIFGAGLLKSVGSTAISPVLNPLGGLAAETPFGRAALERVPESVRPETLGSRVERRGILSAAIEDLGNVALVGSAGTGLAGAGARVFGTTGRTAEALRPLATPLRAGIRQATGGQTATGGALTAAGRASTQRALDLAEQGITGRQVPLGTRVGQRLYETGQRLETNAVRRERARIYEAAGRRALRDPAVQLARREAMNIVRQAGVDRRTASKIVGEELFRRSAIGPLEQRLQRARDALVKQGMPEDELPPALRRASPIPDALRQPAGTLSPEHERIFSRMAALYEDSAVRRTQELLRSRLKDKGLENAGIDFTLPTPKLIKTYEQAVEAIEEARRILRDDVPLAQQRIVDDILTQERKGAKLRGSAKTMRDEAVERAVAIRMQRDYIPHALRDVALDDTAATILREIRANGGVTVSPHTGKTYDAELGGFAVGVERGTSLRLDAEMPDIDLQAQLAGWLRTMRPVVQDAENFIGGWVDTKTNTIHLDPTTILPDRDLANNLGAALQQEATWGFGADQEIAVFGAADAARQLVQSGARRRFTRSLRKATERTAMQPEDVDVGMALWDQLVVAAHRRNPEKFPDADSAYRDIAVRYAKRQPPKDRRLTGPELYAMVTLDYKTGSLPRVRRLAEEFAEQRDWYYKTKPAVTAGYSEAPAVTLFDGRQIPATEFMYNALAGLSPNTAVKPNVTQADKMYRVLLQANREGRDIEWVLDRVKSLTEEGREGSTRQILRDILSGNTIDRWTPEMFISKQEDAVAAARAAGKSAGRKIPVKRIEEARELGEKIARGEESPARFAELFNVRPKVTSFYWNLIDPDVADIVTVDTWMARLFGYETVTAQNYKEIADAVRKVAKNLGWKPHEVQAALWFGAKDRLLTAETKYWNRQFREGTIRQTALADERKLLAGARGKSAKSIRKRIARIEAMQTDEEVLRFELRRASDRSAVGERFDKIIEELPDDRHAELFQNVSAGDILSDVLGSYNPESNVMKFWQKADVSTLFHEMGHWLRQALPGEELTPLERAAGVVDGVWTREAEEWWADQFVNYLRTREAPKPELRSAFERTRALLATWWQRVRETFMGREDVDPEVVRTLDSWFGETFDEQRYVPLVHYSREARDVVGATGHRGTGILGQNAPEVLRGEKTGSSWYVAGQAPEAQIGFSGRYVHGTAVPRERLLDITDPELLPKIISARREGKTFDQIAKEMGYLGYWNTRHESPAFRNVVNLVEDVRPDFVEQARLLKRGEQPQPFELPEEFRQTLAQREEGAWRALPPTTAEEVRRAPDLPENVGRAGMYQRGVRVGRAREAQRGFERRARQFESEAAKVDRSIARMQRSVQDDPTLLPEYRRADQMRRQAQAQLGRVLRDMDKIHRLKPSQIPAQWRPMIMGIQDLQRGINAAVKDGRIGALTGIAIMQDVPQTFSEVVAQATMNGFKPQHFRNFTPQQLERLMFANLKLGRTAPDEVIAEVEAGTRKLRKGPEFEDRERSIEALIAAQREVAWEGATNAVVDYVEGVVARPIPASRRLPDGWVEWDPQKTRLLEGKLAEDGAQLAARDATMMIPAQVATTLRRASESVRSPWPVEMLQRVSRPWRALVLTYSPRWYLNNTISNFILASFEMGLGASAFRAWRDAYIDSGGFRSPERLRELARRNPQKYGRFIGEGGQVVRFPDTPEQLLQNSVVQATLSDMIDPSVVPRAEGRVGLREAYREGAAVGGRLARIQGVRETMSEISERLRRANTFVDEMARTAVFKHTYAKTGDRVRAVEAGLKALVDYSGMGPWERSLVRAAVPFYSWQRGILLTAMGLPVDHPARVALTMTVGRVNSELLGEEYRAMPDIYKGGVVLAEDAYLSGKGFNPFIDALDITTFDGVARSLNPFLEVALRKGLGASDFPYGPKRIGPMGFAVPDVTVGEALDDTFAGAPPFRLGLQAARSLNLVEPPRTRTQPTFGRELGRFTGVNLRTREDIDRVLERLERERKVVESSLREPEPVSAQPRRRSRGRRGRRRVEA